MSKTGWPTELKGNVKWTGCIGGWALQSCRFNELKETDGLSEQNEKVGQLQEDPFLFGIFLYWGDYFLSTIFFYNITKEMRMEQAFHSMNQTTDIYFYSMPSLFHFISQTKEYSTYTAPTLFHSLEITMSFLINFTL